MPLTETEHGIIKGTLSCDYSNGMIQNINNRIIEYAEYKSFPVITQSEAYRRLSEGKFLMLYDIGNVDGNTIDVTAVTMDYRIDTKGYFQPVYVFEGVHGDAVVKLAVPAVE